MSSLPPDQYVLAGKITGVHGVRGMLKVLPYADDPASLLQYDRWYVRRAHETTLLLLEKGQVYQQKGLLLKFKGLDTPEASRLWVGAELLLDRSLLPDLEHGHYWADLEGLEVYTVEGLYLGKVSHLFETGANDVLVVKDGGHEVLIPYVPGHIVMEVNEEEGKIVVDWEAPDAI
ncbi:MAG: ribosome maturation factor RimM [Gammaproteobacteria bacterium]